MIKILLHFTAHIDCYNVFNMGIFLLLFVRNSNYHYEYISALLLCVCYSFLCIYYFVFYVLSGAKKIGINPKINNMIQGYESAKYEYILISDSGLKSKWYSI